MVWPPATLASWSAPALWRFPHELARITGSASVFAKKLRRDKGSLALPSVFICVHPWLKFFVGFGDIWQIDL
ncbi:MAG TPA: hypothetical protein VGN23_13900 [Verrucomicrobiae bacterium]